jgi:hypothetical protein
MMRHEDAADLLGVYALDAVEPDEAAAIEAHLETCPRCRAELRNHREVVGVLAYAGQEAPEGMWDRVAARIHDPAPDDEPVDPPRPLPLLAARRRSRLPQVGRSRLPQVMGLVAAAAVIVVALLGVEVGHLRTRTNHLSGQVAAMAPTAPTMTAVRLALATPGARMVALKSQAGPRVSLDAVILPSGAGYLYDTDLAPLSPEQTYQLWGVVGNQVISYGVLGATPSPVMAFRASSGVQALAVTAEVAGGVVSSTQKPVVSGSVVS